MADEDPQVPENAVTWKLNELEKRLDQQAEEIKILRTRSHDMANLVQGYADYGRRLEELEKANPEVILTRLKFLEAALIEVKDGQKANTRILWTIAVALITATVTTAIAIASGTFG